jgi:uncharacterized protein YndB with AHSA1/START domain
MSGTAQNGYEIGVERYIDAPPHVVWSVWVERLEEWFCPKPWTTELVAMGFVPGWSAVADQLAALAEAQAQGG